MPSFLNTKVNLYVDGKFIPSTSRVVNDSSGFDGRAYPPYPDITKRAHVQALAAKS